VSSKVILRVVPESNESSRANLIVICTVAPISKSDVVIELGCLLTGVIVLMLVMNTSRFKSAMIAPLDVSYCILYTVIVRSSDGQESLPKLMPVRLRRVE
jgi:hypothetical protein